MATATFADLTAVNDLRMKLNTVKLHYREANLEMNSVQEHRSENLYNTVVQLMKAVGNHLQLDDILHVTRVAKLSKDTERKKV